MCMNILKMVITISPFFFNIINPAIAKLTPDDGVHSHITEICIVSDVIQGNAK